MLSDCGMNRIERYNYAQALFLTNGQTNKAVFCSRLRHHSLSIYSTALWSAARQKKIFLFCVSQCIFFFAEVGLDQQ